MSEGDCKVSLLFFQESNNVAFSLLLPPDPKDFTDKAALWQAHHSYFILEKETDEALSSHLVVEQNCLTKRTCETLPH